MELIVTCRELQYAGKTYLTGARFEATEKDAKLLKAINKAADAPAKPAKPLREAASVAPPPPAPPPEGTELRLDALDVPAAERDLAAAPEGRPYRTRRLKSEE